MCYKPFGDECATQSVLQYWQMSRTLYVSGIPPYHTKLSPEFCFSHWSTQVCNGRSLCGACWITYRLPRPAQNLSREHQALQSLCSADMITVPWL